MRWQRAGAAACGVLLVLGLARCLDEPNYAGLACSADAPCPEGFVCNEALVCERSCAGDLDCPSGAVCTLGRCTVPGAGEDAGVPDSSTVECESPEDCASPGPCEVLDDRVACAEGRCYYPPKVCDEPPPGECLEDDTKYKSYSGVGTCDPASGACDYTEVVIDCLDCSASCLLQCEGLACNESNGGCRREGHCTPGDPPSCAYVNEPDATPCDLGGVGGGGVDGFCLSGECVGCIEDAHCDDGNACTRVDTCDQGTCTGSDPVLCDVAPGECYESPGECDPTDGSCIFTTKPDAATCDDANMCTTNDACSDGDCIGATPLDCDDQNVCTDDSCDPATGCTRTNNTAACDDGNACSINDVCADGGCAPGAPLDCNDGNPCTTDGCDPASGCTHVTLADGEPCLFADGPTGMCSQGACVGCTLDVHCDDANPCTTDTCAGAMCSYVNNTGACDDADACTYGDQCSAGVCAGTTITCTSNTCVTRSCNGTASCTQTFHSGRACADDGNACTTDVCNGSGTCTHPTRANGSSCGANAANRCCGGSCVNISTSEANCGGCGTSCASGLTCETVSATGNCSSSPANTSGRCRCNASNAQCPRGQLCRTVSPYTNRCTPNGAGNCAAGQTFVDISSCPNYCRY